MNSNQNPSLENILNNLTSSKKTSMIDKKNVIQKIVKTHNDILKNYQFIEPEHYVHDLQKGDLIRHIKSVDGKLSCIGSIVHINYKNYTYVQKGTENQRIDKNNALIDHIVLESLKYKQNYWKIYPENFFIFKYTNPTKTSGTSKMIKEYFEENMNTLDFNVLIKADPSIKNKIIPKNKAEVRPIRSFDDALKYTDDLIKEYDPKLKSKIRIKGQNQK
jgi:hypothetical protein